MRDGGLVTEPGGNVYFAADLGGASITCTSTSGPQTFAGGNGLVMAYTTAGQITWKRVLTSTVSLQTWDLARDGAGGLYVGGRANGTANFGCAPVTSSVNKLFVTKLDSSGNCVRTNEWGDGNQYFYALTVDGAGNATIAGTNDSGSIDFGNGVNNTPGMFVAHFDPTGALRWTKAFPSGHYTAAYSLGADMVGNVFIGGLAGPNLNLGDGPLPASNVGYLINLASQYGTRLWSRAYPAYPTDLAVGQRISVIGNYTGNIQLGGSSLMGPGHDVFFMSVDP